MDIKRIEKYLNKKILESEETVKASMQHPYGGRGRIGYRKGICPHCGNQIDLRKLNKE